MWAPNESYKVVSLLWTEKIRLPALSVLSAVALFSLGVKLYSRGVTFHHLWNNLPGWLNPFNMTRCNRRPTYPKQRSKLVEPATPAEQPLEAFLVLDVEATCSEVSGFNYANEIIVRIQATPLFELVLMAKN